MTNRDIAGRQPRTGATAAQQADAGAPTPGAEEPDLESVVPDEPEDITDAVTDAVDDATTTAVPATADTAAAPTASPAGELPATAAAAAGDPDRTDLSGGSHKTRPVTATAPGGTEDVVAPTPVDAGAAQPLTASVVAPQAAPARAAAPAVSALTVSRPSTGPAATELAATAAPVRPPVTVKSIVTDVLTWIGLGSLAAGLPIPALPVPAFVASMWLAVRQTEYTLNNQRPVVQPTLSGQGPDGVVTGNLNATDYDDQSLTYTVTDAPEHGSLVIDQLGNFTYTPDADTAAAGGADRFTVAVDDNAGNPAHVHGLLALAGLAGPTRATVTLSVAPTGQAAQPGGGSGAVTGVGAATPAGSSGTAGTATVDPQALADLLARDGLVVSMRADGTVGVVDGTFTDTVVTSAADAATVLNAMAPLLGAPSSVASADAIVTQHVEGIDGVGESFYRLSATVDGMSVLGSDVVLVTDADGRVTGLFNHYLDSVDTVDLTPAANIDQSSEAVALASAAYLGGIGAQANLGTVDDFVSSATFTDNLVVYALDGASSPSLAWRVVIQPSDENAVQLSVTDPSAAGGATYFLYANGAHAGAVIVQMSNLEAAAATTVARDSLGQNRTINIDSSTYFFFFNVSSLVDKVRDIHTYQTSYGWFGLGAPVLPGNLVQKGWWWGWNSQAVSAHANTADVFDYYQNVLGLTSFNGDGAAVKVSINYNPRQSVADLFSNYNNAFWDPYRQQFVFGNGGNLEAAVDVVGHEYTHAVVSYILGAGGSVLDYGESGALNEAMADIMGSLIEGKSGPDRWLIGEDSKFPGGAIRNLADPSSITTAYGPYADNYADRYTGTGDDAGEHINSTIFSFAAYKMMTDPATAGISNNTWADMFYHSLYRLSASANFADGRDAVVSTARAFGFTDPQVAAIEKAFDDVGISGVSSLSMVAV